MRPAAQKEQKCKEEYERIISKTLSNMKTCCKMAMVGMRMFHSNGKENHMTKLFRLSERLHLQYTSPIHDKHDYVFVHSYTSFTHDQTTTYLLAHTNLTSKRWIRIQLSKFQKTVIPRTFVCPHLGKIS